MTDAAASLLDQDALIARFRAAGQGHVFANIAALDQVARRALLRDAAALDLEQVAALRALPTEADHSDAVIEGPGPELIARAASPDEIQRRRAARDRGIDMIAAGRVAVIVAAGGQGTRLGSPEPKAMFSVGPKTGRSLIAWLAAKVVHWSRRVDRPIPFIVMVSEATADATRTFLEEYQWFGLGRENVYTPVQGSLTPLDDQGKLLLDTPSSIARSPNGHGGTYAAVNADGLLATLRATGVTTLSYVQVDNPLIHPLDPVFLGYHDQARSQISSKSVAKRGPAEKVGVFARVNGRPSVVEYSELTDEQAHAVDRTGKLVFGQGSIAAHCVELDFAERMAEQGLPIHRARKKVPFVDAAGQLVEPDAPNATKFETFLFDAIPLAERALFVETLRAEEFSPIKNAAGSDSPATSAADVQALFRGWYERAQLPVPDGLLEIDPEDAPDEVTFREHHDRGGAV